MKRLEYMMELRKYLFDGGLPEEELDNALSFYEELFLDAGVENEAETAKNLGDPKQLARQILIDNNINPDGQPEYFVEKNVNTGNKESHSQHDFVKNEYTPQTSSDPNGTLKKILIIILTFPIWLPIICAIGGIAFGLVVGFGAIVFSLFVSGAAIAASGIAVLFHAPPVGFVLFGVGLVLTGISGLIVVPLVKWLWRLGVKFFNWIIKFFQKIFGVRSVA